MSTRWILSLLTIAIVSLPASAQAFSFNWQGMSSSRPGSHWTGGNNREAQVSQILRTGTLPNLEQIAGTLQPPTGGPSNFLEKLINLKKEILAGILQSHEVPSCLTSTSPDCHGASSVPEPSAALVFGAGALVVAGRMRRNKR